jgi:signal transduction histidine kinase
MARIDNFTLELSIEKFSLSALISTIVKDFRNQIHDGKQRNLDLIYNNTTIPSNSKHEDNNKDVIIRADKDRIAQVIINMVDNAIKNTDCGKIVVTTITITTTINSHHAEDKDNPNFQNELIVKVKDSGTGLDPEIFSKVFSKFYTASGLGSTGLGLYICKAIVEAHEGSIWVENNTDDMGATFSFSLPLNA